MRRSWVRIPSRARIRIVVIRDSSMCIAEACWNGRVSQHGWSRLSAARRPAAAAGRALMATDPVRRAIEHAPLVDHHVHSVLRHVDDRATFESFLTESDWPAAEGSSYFDSFLGAALLRVCAPVLDLAPTATPNEYLARRTELGGETANRRLLRATGVTELLVDDGLRSDDLADVPE